MEWLEGDGCPLLVVGLMDGVLRRFSLAQSPASLGCNLTSSVDAITSLSYSNRLKLVAYATGGGEAGVLACISRLNPRYIEERGWDGAIRCIPRAPLFKIAYKIDSSSTETGSWSVAQGKDIPTVAPCEYWRGAKHVSCWPTAYDTATPSLMLVLSCDHLPLAVPALPLTTSAFMCSKV